MIPSSMRVIEILESGGPEVLQLGQRPVPDFGDDQVLVKIKAAGVNGPDMAQRKGLYPPPPGASDLLGLEISGEIVATGDHVKRWQVGDAICALTNGGGYAEYVAIDAGQCLSVPKGLSVEDAAGLPETYFTVWSNFFLNRTIEKDALFLVHGGAGGIGSTAVQLGNALGLRIFATCSHEDKEFVESLGAERAIDYREEDYVDILKNAGGADLILDILGGDYINRNIKAAKPDARIVSLAFNKGAVADVNFMPIMMKRLTLTGSTLRARPPAFKAAIAADLQDKVWPLFENETIRPVTDRTYPLEQAEEAHKAMEAGDHRGKILLTL